MLGSLLVFFYERDVPKRRHRCLAKQNCFCRFCTQAPACAASTLFSIPSSTSSSRPCEEPLKEKFYGLVGLNVDSVFHTRQKPESIHRTHSEKPILKKGHSFKGSHFDMSKTSFFRLSKVQTGVFPKPQTPLFHSKSLPILLLWPWFSAGAFLESKPSKWLVLFETTTPTVGGAQDAPYNRTERSNLATFRAPSPSIESAL